MPMIARWVRDAIEAAGISGAELARQMKARGFSVDRAAINKMMLEHATPRTKPRKVTASELIAISEITSFPLPLELKSGKSLDAEHIDSEAIAASLDHDSDSIRQAEPPFEGAVAQITGHMGGGSTGEVVTMPAGDMQTIEPVAAWWKIPGEALTGFGFRDIMPAHIVGWFMDGASMEPTIQRTDVVFIDTRRRAPDPEGIFAVDYGEGRTLKRIRVLRTPEGVKFELRSDNSARFDPVTCAPDEVTIFGRYLFRFTVF